MNEYQKERENVFQNTAFSENRKLAVLNELTIKRKVKWQPIFAFFAFATIASFFIFTSTPNDLTQNSDRSTLEGYFDSIYSYDNEQEEKMKLLFKKENILQKNDAVILSYYPSQKEFYYIHYLLYENDEWRIKDSTGIHHTKNGVNFNVLKYDNNFIYVGPMNNVLPDKTVYVGNKEAIVLKDKQIQPIWIQKGNSYGTPVFYKASNELTRLVQYEHSLSFTSAGSPLPVLEAIGDYSVIQYKSSSMYGAQDNYTEYPLVIDHLYYKEYEPSIGDVIMIERNGIPQIVRIKGRGPSDLTVSEGSILTDGFFMDVYYMMAAEEGNIHVDYTNMVNRQYSLLENQYFVQSDNWASDEFYEGIIVENEIRGKVAGYSLMHIEPNWSQEEINLYNEYKKDQDQSLLKDINAKTIFRLQKYAITLKDYKTAYTLFDQDSIGISYEKWAESMRENTSLPSLMKRYIYEAHLISNASEDKSGKDIIFTNPKTEKKLATVNFKDGVFKVKYEQVTDLTLN